MFSQTVGSNDYFDYICDMRYLGADDNEQCSATWMLEIRELQDAVRVLRLLVDGHLIKMCQTCCFNHVSPRPKEPCWPQVSQLSLWKSSQSPWDPLWPTAVLPTKPKAKAKQGTFPWPWLPPWHAMQCCCCFCYEAVASPLCPTVSWFQCLDLLLQIHVLILFLFV